MPIYDSRNAEAHFPIALVVSRFNAEITDKLLEGARERLVERGFEEKQVSIVYVPGAVEIPLAAQKLAQSGLYEAVVTLGAVIRGDTDHYDYVCTQVSNGCQQVALQHGVPVIFGVLTTDNDAQAQERVGGRHGHKGRDAIDAAVETVAVLKALPAGRS